MASSLLSDTSCFWQKSFPTCRIWAMFFSQQFPFQLLDNKAIQGAISINFFGLFLHFNLPIRMQRRHTNLQRLEARYNTSNQHTQMIPSPGLRRKPLIAIRYLWLHDCSKISTQQLASLSSNSGIVVQYLSNNQKNSRRWRWFLSYPILHRSPFSACRFFVESPFKSGTSLNMLLGYCLVPCSCHLRGLTARQGAVSKA